jgi:putative membrane protein
MTPNGSDDPRVRYAIERTLLAWTRTGLALMGFGFVVARFGLFLRELEAARQGIAPRTPAGMSLWIGTALVLLGVVVNLLVAAEHVRLMRHIPTLAPYRIYSWLLGVCVTIILAVLGIMIAFYLLFVAR